jgi:hypothetical protein
LEESIGRTQQACAGKRQDEPSVPVFEGVAHQHRRDSEQTKPRQSIQVGTPVALFSIVSVILPSSTAIWR